MSTPPASPAVLLRRLVASDPGRPRITVYDDTDSPTRGERIELSARVLANWVAKAANLLRDDLDVGEGSVVLLDLPPHWRTLYWAFAAWSVGACVEVPAHRTSGDAGQGPAPSAAGAIVPDVVVTDAVGVAAAATEAVLVTLAALARSAAGPVPAGVVDEARELATHGDVFDGWAQPDGSEPALRAAGVLLTYADLPTGSSGSSGSTGAPQRIHTGTPDTAQLLRLALSVWAADGSLVLTRGEPDPAVLVARLAAEGVSAASAPRPPST
ncbi:MAG: TIGR03089 family protein [Ornithinibacter sp.]